MPSVLKFVIRARSFKRTVSSLTLGSALFFGLNTHAANDTPYLEPMRQSPADCARLGFDCSERSENNHRDAIDSLGRIADDPDQITNEFEGRENEYPYEGGLREGCENFR